MTLNVFTVEIDQDLLVSDEILEWRRIRQIPVVNKDGSLVGLIRHRDLLKAALEAKANGRGGATWKIPVKQLMHANPHSIGPRASMQDAAKILRAEKSGCLPVVERGRLVGILTEYDFLPIVESL